LTNIREEEERNDERMKQKEGQKEGRETEEEQEDEKTKKQEEGRKSGDIRTQRRGKTEVTEGKRNGNKEARRTEAGYESLRVVSSVMHLKLAFTYALFDLKDKRKVDTK
jgi:hypothetical protein